jgi:hypothetical protein
MMTGSSYLQKYILRRFIKSTPPILNWIPKKYSQLISSSKARGRFNFSTVVKLKGQGESLFGEIARRLFVPIIVVLGGVLIYWIYNNYLALYSPIDFFK